MEELTTVKRGIRFGLYEVDFASQELRKAGIKIKIQDQPFQILALLLERPGQIVTREEIQKRLWAGDTFVDFDLGLNSAVKKLRQALGDESDNPRFIETLYPARVSFSSAGARRGCEPCRNLNHCSANRNQLETGQKPVGMEWRRSPGVVPCDSRPQESYFSTCQYRSCWGWACWEAIGCGRRLCHGSPGTSRSPAMAGRNTVLAPDGERLYFGEYDSGILELPRCRPRAEKQPDCKHPSPTPCWLV